MAADPEQPRSRALPLLAAAERHSCWWSGTRRRASYPQDRVHARAVRGAGGAHAGGDGGGLRGRPLSYGELNARANQLAHHLRARGVGRTCWWRVRRALAGDGGRAAGILKAGGAYVPLDPAYPGGAAGVHAGGRGGAAVLVTDRRGSAGGCERAGTGARVAGDRPGADAALRSPTARRSGPVPALDRADLAYVIYTSGSTGQPKGVMIEHAGW